MMLRGRGFVKVGYPGIAARVKAEGGEIHWGDETALANTNVRGRSYAPKGQTPVAMDIGGTRQKLSGTSRNLTWPGSGRTLPT